MPRTKTIKTFEEFETARQRINELQRNRLKERLKNEPEFRIKYYNYQKKYKQEQNKLYKKLRDEKKIVD